MKPIWLIQDYQDEDSYKKLANEVIKQGMDVSFIPCVREDMRHYVNDKSESVVSNSKGIIDRPIIIQASMNAVKYIQKQKPHWIPNAWTTWANYECSKYYAHIGQYLLNDDYIMMPLSEVKRRIDYLFNTIGDGNSVFIRPSSGYKYFTGQLFTRDTFIKDWQWVESFAMPETLLVVSSPKKILQEYRFVVVDHVIITGSTYNKDTKSYTVLNKLDDVFNQAQDILNDITYTPDDIFILDIAWHESGAYNILELNSFSCAGLYACDLSIIVKQASELAIRNYNDSTEQKY